MMDLQSLRFECLRMAMDNGDPLTVAINTAEEMVAFVITGDRFYRAEKEPEIDQSAAATEAAE